jgi:hypothetical protein
MRRQRFVLIITRFNHLSCCNLPASETAPNDPQWQSLLSSSNVRLCCSLRFWYRFALIAMPIAANNSANWLEKGQLNNMIMELAVLLYFIEPSCFIRWKKMEPNFVDRIFSVWYLTSHSDDGPWPYRKKLLTVAYICIWNGRVKGL